MAKKNLNKLISTPQKIIDTGKPLKNNKIITDSDRITSNELSTMVDSPQLSINKLPVVDKNTLSSSDSKTLLNEEQLRRKIDAERREDVKRAKLDEMERRELHKKQIQLMKDEFQLFLKSKFPEFVGQKQIQDNGEEILKQDIELRKREYAKDEIRLKDAIVDRLEREKLRKTQEANLKVNKVTVNQTFFEDEVKKEYEQKLKFNPEIENLNDIDMTKNQISELEKQLNRKIVPHRDMMDSRDGVVLIKERITPNS
tara:strand:- start:664 stop:1431 length:768 start_codon:yes stop_codon:yes gene_type:complete